MFVSWRVHALIAMPVVRYGSPHFPRFIPGNFLDSSGLPNAILAVLVVYHKCIDKNGMA